MSIVPDDSASTITGLLQKTPAQPPRYLCEHCQTSFQRREHLQRHVRCHLEEKSFSCWECTKSFSRKDTLKRHLVTHGYPFNGPSNRAAQACRHCIRSKQRCTGQQPCDRCNRRGLQCHFAKPGSHPVINCTTAVDPRDPQLGDAAWPEAQETANDNISSAPTTLPGALFMDGMVDTETSIPALWDITFPLGTDTLDTSDIMAFDFDENYERNTPSDQMMPRPQPSETVEFRRTPGIVADTSARPHNLVMQHMDPSPDTGQAKNQRVPSEPPFPQFPAFSPDDVDLIMSEDFCHVPEISVPAYDALLQIYSDVLEVSPDGPRAPFPRRDAINTFTQLYFEFFHPGFPLLHQATFEHQQKSTLLLLPIAAIGCQYSRVKSRGQCARVLLEIFRRALYGKMKCEAPLQNDLHLAQATLLGTFAMTFSGRHQGLLQAQYLRNVIVTICRPRLARSILFKGSCTPDIHTDGRGWSDWVAAESWTRVVYFTWFTEYLQWTLFDLPPLISVSELCVCLPSDDAMWQCSDQIEFSRWMRSEAAESSPTPSVLDILHRKELSRETLQSLGKSALLLTVVSACAEERSISQRISPSLSDGTAKDSEGQRAAQGCSPCARSSFLADHAMMHLTEQFNVSQLYCDDSPPSTKLLSTMKKFHTLSLILSDFPYSLMYVSSGWMASTRDVEINLQQLAKKLQSDPPQARMTLIHAAQLFRLIRNQRWLEAYDPLCLLSATLYIWYYDRFLGKLLDPDAATRPPMKVDQDFDKTSREHWVQDGQNIRIHIAGIGILNGGQSVPSVLKEAIRVLNNAQGWPVLAYAISRALQRVLSGSAPSFDDAL